MTRWVAAALLAAWCLASWTLSSQSDPESYVGVHLRLNDKVEHCIEYAVGGMLVACIAFSTRKRRQGVIAAVAFCASWGAVDEFHQSFVPGRDSSAMDLAADIGGGALGGLAFAAIAAGRRRRGHGTMNPEEVRTN